MTHIHKWLYIDIRLYYQNIVIIFLFGLFLRFLFALASSFAFYLNKNQIINHKIQVAREARKKSLCIEASSNMR